MEGQGRGRGTRGDLGDVGDDLAVLGAELGEGLVDEVEVLEQVDLVLDVTEARERPLGITKVGVEGAEGLDLKER